MELITGVHSPEYVSVYMQTCVLLEAKNQSRLGVRVNRSESIQKCVSVYDPRTFSCVSFQVLSLPLMCSSPLHHHSTKGPVLKPGLTAFI